MKKKLDIILNKASMNLSFKSNNPILITGYPRTGTTWVGTVIAQSEKLSWVYEPFNPNYAYMINDKKCSACGFKLDKYFLYIRTRDSKAIAHYKHVLVSKLFLKKRALFKSPFALFSTPLLAKEFSFKPVILERSALGFISSVIEKQWDFNFNDLLSQEDLMSEYLEEFKDKIELYSKKPKPIIDQAILQWQIYTHTIGRFKKEHPEWLYIEVEQLYKNPVNEFKNIFDYLELEFTSKVEDYIIKSSSKDNPIEGDSTQVHNINRDAKAQVDIYKKRLTKKQIEYISKNI